jgi:hypothetical protein
VTRLILVAALTALFALYLALIRWRRQRKDAETQKRFATLRRHHISGPAHSPERFDSLARLIRERTAS